MLIKAKEKITKSYDVIIVGSGLAGMTAANKLGKNGRKVLLLESHNSWVDLQLGLKEERETTSLMSLFTVFQ